MSAEGVGGLGAVELDADHPVALLQDVAGGASRATDLMMPGIRQSLVQQCSFAMTRDRTTVEPTALPDDINVLGAAAVFLTAQK